MADRYWSTEQQRWVYPGEVEELAAQIVQRAYEWYESSNKSVPEHELAMAVLRHKQAVEAAAKDTRPDQR